MSELVSRIAERIEPLIDQRPMIDASQSEIRRIQAQTIARVAAKVAQDSFEALEARAEKAEAERDALRGAALAMDKSSSDALTSIIAGREALRDVAKQAIDVIESVQTYSQPDDPTEENALTMREHEVFGFDVESARAALNREPE